MTEFKKLAGNCRELVRKKDIHLFSKWIRVWNLQSCWKLSVFPACLVLVRSDWWNQCVEKTTKSTTGRAGVKGTKLELRKLPFQNTILQIVLIFSRIILGVYSVQLQLGIIVILVADDSIMSRKRVACPNFQKNRLVKRSNCIIIWCNLVAYQGQAKGLGPCGGMIFTNVFFFIFHVHCTYT